jgi:hypothetical protein
VIARVWADAGEADRAALLGCVGGVLLRVGGTFIILTIVVVVVIIIIIILLMMMMNVAASHHQACQLPRRGAVPHRWWPAPATTSRSTPAPICSCWPDLPTALLTFNYVCLCFCVVVVVVIDCVLWLLNVYRHAEWCASDAHVTSHTSTATRCIVRTQRCRC